jgi:hypothetical protein
MYGYEYELQRQRDQQVREQAETARMLNQNSKSANTDLRKTVGKQLIKLGTRLQG